VLREITQAPAFIAQGTDNPAIYSRAPILGEYFIYESPGWAYNSYWPIFTAPPWESDFVSNNHKSIINEW
jgi:hypothetical protein